MKKLQLLTVIFFLGGLFFLTSASAQASEGMIELKSTTGQPSRCSVTSTFMPDLNYTLLASCRDLVYPPDVEHFSYLVWATPINEQKAIKLGELGVGKAEFRTPAPFSHLFVTKERSAGVEQPSEEVVMHGQVQPLSFLAGPPPPEITPVATPTPTVTPIPPGVTLLSGLRRAIITFFLIVAALAIVILASIITFRRLGG